MSTGGLAPLYHRKHVKKSESKRELAMNAVADRIDPEEQYHIGHPVVEAIEEAEAPTEEKITIRFHYGGKPLGRIQSESSPDVIRRVLTGFATILEGLALFNKNGLYHLDVKLPNIVYRDNGDLRLIDFGIAQQGPRRRDSIFSNAYPVWPFEVHLLSGEDSVFSDDVFGTYVNDKYLRSTFELLKIDVSHIKDNARLLMKVVDRDQLAAEIFNGIDGYSTGITLIHLLCFTNVYEYVPKSTMKQLLELCRKMIHPYTRERISIQDALVEYRQILSVGLS